VPRRNRDNGPQSVKLQARGMQYLAADHPLSFPPPLAERSDNRSAFEHSWHLLQFVFELPDPREFPVLANVGPPRSLQILRRYSSAAKELAESAFLAYPARMTVTVLDDGMGEEIDADFAPKENIRGFSVLFRQFHSNREPASFNAVQREIRRLNGEADDEFSGERTDYLTAWGRAAGKLRGFPLPVLIGKQLQARGRWPPGPIVGEQDPPPDLLISIYNYGDDIHWGEQYEKIAAWGESQFDSARMRMSFFQAITGLAHIYIGFSLLVDAALGVES
jgi:hypothetical protein